MLQQIMDALGVQSEDEILDKLNELKDSPEIAAKVTHLEARVGELETANQTLTSQLEQKSELLGDAMDRMAQQRKKDREATIEQLFTDKRMSPQQREHAIKTFVETDDLNGTEEGYRQAVKYAQLAIPSATFEELTGDGGDPNNGGPSTPKPVTYDSAMKEVNAKARKLVEDGKFARFSEAFDILRKTEPELMDRYDAECEPDIEE